MKKRLLIGLLLINSFVFANTNNKTPSDKTSFSMSNIHTCTYEYYDEIFDEAGNVNYLFLYSEQVECNEDEAGETYAYTYNQTAAKRKRINVESTLSVAK